MQVTYLPTAAAPTTAAIIKPVNLIFQGVEKWLWV